MVRCKTKGTLFYQAISGFKILENRVGQYYYDMDFRAGSGNDAYIREATIYLKKLD